MQALIDWQLPRVRKKVRQEMALYDERETVDIDTPTFSEAQVLGEDEQP